MKTISILWKSIPSAFPVQAFVLGYIAAFAFGNLCFKKAGDQTGAGWLGFFMLGNVICFCSTFFETWALGNRNPNVIFAACMGGGFCALQIVSFLVFKTPLGLPQWLGVGLIGLGILCLQWKS